MGAWLVASMETQTRDPVAGELPRVVLLMSGKRKSGKDYVVGKLQELLTEEECTVLRLSGPLKQQYAKEHGLDYQRLLDSSSYKEEHRQAMIRWGEERRDQEPSYFCSLACQQAAMTPVWLVSDARRPTDIAYFQSQYCCVRVRVWASECVREERGWRFVPGVDDAPSECALDTYSCDFTITNDGEDTLLVEQLQTLLQLVRSSASTDSCSEMKFKPV